MTAGGPRRSGGARWRVIQRDAMGPPRDACIFMCILWRCRPGPEKCPEGTVTACAKGDGARRRSPDPHADPHRRACAGTTTTPCFWNERSHRGGPEPLPRPGGAGPTTYYHRLPASITYHFALYGAMFAWPVRTRQCARRGGRREQPAARGDAGRIENPPMAELSFEGYVPMRTSTCSIRFGKWKRDRWRWSHCPKTPSYTAHPLPPCCTMPRASPMRPLARCRGRRDGAKRLFLEAARVCGCRNERRVHNNRVIDLLDDRAGDAPRERSPYRKGRP